jgi:nitrogen fixation NifU-like protein
MSMRYSKKAMDIFSHPKNMGEMRNPDGVGRVGNPTCGDIMELYLRVSKTPRGEIIKDIKVKTFGCVAAIVTSSILTEMAKGKTLEEALKISKMDIVKAVEGLPPQKIHCSVLAAGALQEAVYDYLSRHNRAIPAGLMKSHELARRTREMIEHRHGHDPDEF